VFKTVIYSVGTVYTLISLLTAKSSIPPSKQESNCRFPRLTSPRWLGGKGMHLERFPTKGSFRGLDGGRSASDLSSSSLSVAIETRAWTSRFKVQNLHACVVISVNNTVRNDRGEEKSMLCEVVFIWSVSLLLSNIINLGCKDYDTV